MAGDIAELEVAMTIWLGIPEEIVPEIAKDERRSSSALHGELADHDGAVIEALDVVRVRDVEEDLVAGKVAVTDEV